MTVLLTQFMPRLKSKTWRSLIKGFVLGMLLTICVGGTGCSTLKSQNARTDVSCEVFKVITWSDKDTKPTLEQVFLHNTTFDSICAKDDTNK